MKNKKTIFIIIAILLLCLVGGASYIKLKGDSDNDDSGSKSTESKGIFTSVKDALSKNITLVCEFKDDSGTSVKSYIKNGAVRVSSTTASGSTQSGDIIMKDKKMYMWDLKTKQGFVYDIPDADTSTDSKVGMTSTEVNQSESYLNMIDKYKDSCKAATVEDSYFTPPTDVKFQDMSKYLEDLKKQMPSIPNQ